MKGLIYCKQHDRHFGYTRQNAAGWRVTDIAQHLWGAHNVPFADRRQLARKIATGESDFPASAPLPQPGSLDLLGPSPPLPIPSTAKRG